MVVVVFKLVEYLVFGLKLPFMARVLMQCNIGLLGLGDVCGVWVWSNDGEEEI